MTSKPKTCIRCEWSRITHLTISYNSGSELVSTYECHSSLNMYTNLVTEKSEMFYADCKSARASKGGCGIPGRWWQDTDLDIAGEDSHEVSN